MASSFELTEKLDSELQRVNPFVEKVCRELLSRGISQEDIFNTKLALEEALTNAMRHGNQLNDRLQVSVHIRMEEDSILMDVHDQGKGFDFKNLPDPTKSDYGAKPSGRGVCLMRKLMDEVEFYHAGSGVRMTKKLGKKR
jgi:serine/threonine-protein kinase RsbW